MAEFNLAESANLAALDAAMTDAQILTFADQLATNAYMDCDDSKVDLALAIFEALQEGAREVACFMIWCYCEIETAPTNAQPPSALSQTNPDQLVMFGAS